MVGVHCLRHRRMHCRSSGRGRRRGRRPTGDEAQGEDSAGSACHHARGHHSQAHRIQDDGHRHIGLLQHGPRDSAGSLGSQCRLDAPAPPEPPAELHGPQIVDEEVVVALGEQIEHQPRAIGHVLHDHPVRRDARVGGTAQPLLHQVHIPARSQHVHGAAGRADRLAGRPDEEHVQAGPGRLRCSHRHQDHQARWLAVHPIQDDQDPLDRLAAASVGQDRGEAGQVGRRMTTRRLQELAQHAEGNVDVAAHRDPGHMGLDRGTEQLIDRQSSATGMDHLVGAGDVSTLPGQRDG